MSVTQDEIDARDAWWDQLDQDLHYQEEVMKTRDMIESKFLRKEDFDEDQTCTIKGVKLEEVVQNEQKWIIYFREHAKGMVLNITSIRVLEAAYGDDTDLWMGKKVTIYVDPNVSFQGRVVGGLRLRPMKDRPSARDMQASSPPPAREEGDPGFDEEIPF